MILTQMELAAFPYQIRQAPSIQALQFTETALCGHILHSLISLFLAHPPRNVPCPLCDTLRSPVQKRGRQRKQNSSADAYAFGGSLALLNQMARRLSTLLFRENKWIHNLIDDFFQ